MNGMRNSARTVVCLGLAKSVAEKGETQTFG